MARFLHAMALSADAASERRMPISSRSFSGDVAGPSPRAVAAAMTSSAGRKTTDVADGRDECMRAIPVQRSKGSKWSKRSKRQTRRGAVSLQLFDPFDLFDRLSYSLHGSRRASERR